MKELNLTCVIFTSSDSRCSWHLFGQSLYRFYGEAMSYDDARVHCVSNGGDLAIIKSEELNVREHKLRFHIY